MPWLGLDSDLPKLQTRGEGPTYVPYVAPEPELPVHRTLRLATFNLRVLGRSKASDPEMMRTLAQIITRYDIVAVQEIKDITEQAAHVLAAAVSEASPHHQMLLGPRSGLQPDDRSSQEQYAYFYDARLLAPEGPGEVFDDFAEDLFQREPFVARFVNLDGGPTMVLANVHTRPAAAVQEIDALHPVMAWSKNRNRDAHVVIALGDFNAGCHYASPEELDTLPIRNHDYVWAIPDDADTNLASAQCAYDRVVFDEEGVYVWSGQWGVDRAFEDSSVSDHWPVWVELEWMR